MLPRHSMTSNSWVPLLCFCHVLSCLLPGASLKKQRRRVAFRHCCKAYAWQTVGFLSPCFPRPYFSPLEYLPPIFVNKSIRVSSLFSGPVSQPWSRKTVSRYIVGRPSWMILQDTCSFRPLHCLVQARGGF